MVIGIVNFKGLYSLFMVDSILCCVNGFLFIVIWNVKVFFFRF